MGVTAVTNQAIRCSAAVAIAMVHIYDQEHPPSLSVGNPSQRQMQAGALQLYEIQSFCMAA